MASVLVGALALAPLAGAAKVREDDRMVSAWVVDRARVENLQRWVSAGHADWCKDARLVAAEELWRLAPDFSGDGFELNGVETSVSGDANGGNRVTFEWAPLDGRAVYRVTVERFDWLLPIAKTRNRWCGCRRARRFALTNKVFRCERVQSKGRVCGNGAGRL
jgi:hypothetical protein